MLDAERRLGEILSKTPKHPPGPDKQDRSQCSTDLPPTLADLGIDKKTSARSQQLVLDAERKLGEILSKTPKATGTRGQLIGPGVIGGTTTAPPIDTLADLGIDKKTWARAR